MVKVVSISDEAFEVLDRLRRELGTGTYTETILFLAREALFCMELKKIGYKINVMVELLARMLKRLGMNEEGVRNLIGLEYSVLNCDARLFLN